MRRYTVVLAIALIVGAATVAVAAIPDSAGVIHACYDAHGRLRVIESDAGQLCKQHEYALNWNVQGPTGPAGVSATEARVRMEGEDTCGTSSDFVLGERCSTNPADGVLAVDSFYLDPVNYPATATYHIEGAFLSPAHTTVCARLYDYTAHAPVVGSDDCFANPAASEMWAEWHSDAFELASGRHQYAIQTSATPPVINGVALGDLIIDW